MKASRAVWGMAIGCSLAVAEARATPSSVHRVALPEPRVSPSGRDWGDVDAAPGEGPGVAHPRGTVVVAEAIGVEPSPSVTEWDLASGALVRSAPLPLSAAFADLRIVRAGDAYHVVASAGPGGDVVHARLGRGLDVRAVDRLGAGERARIATDGAVVAVLWSGTHARSEEPPGWQLATFDATGERGSVARVADTLDSTFAYGDPLVVAGRKIFVLLSDRGARVARFDAAGKPEGGRPLSWTPDDGRLFRSGARVLFTDDCTVVEIWPGDRFDADRASLPGRRADARACPAFQASGDGDGRLVTTAGDVLSANLRIERHIAVPDGLATRALWVGPCPALVVVGAEGGRASVLWAEPGESL
jgi:hypothetical protein